MVTTKQLAWQAYKATEDTGWNPAELARRYRLWWRRNTEIGITYKRQSKEHWRRRNLHKARAHLQLHRAVVAGKVERGACEICGETDVEGHHYLGYEYPLVVRWLCSPHHREIHKGEA